MSEMTPPAPLRIAVLISGGGTTLKNLLEQKAQGTLNIDIPVVISSNPDAGGLRYAKDAGIPTIVTQSQSFDNIDKFSAAVFGPCRTAHVDYVVMGGFLKLVRIPDDFENRVVNIHPALIPNHCGAGFYGLRVHQSVINAGDQTSGCTVHFVDNEYDHGPIILQRSVSVAAEDTPESLAARVFEAECEAYPEALRLLQAGRVRVSGQTVSIRDASSEG